MMGANIDRFLHFLQMIPDIYGWTVSGTMPQALGGGRCTDFRQGCRR